MTIRYKISPKDYSLEDRDHPCFKVYQSNCDLSNVREGSYSKEDVVVEIDELCNKLLSCGKLTSDIILNEHIVSEKTRYCDAIGVYSHILKEMCHNDILEIKIEEDTHDNDNCDAIEINKYF